MADLLLTAGGALLMIVGLVGCVLPVIPGPPLSFIGLLLLHFTRYADFSFEFGGSRAGMWGAAIGLVLGLIFLPPLGVIIGPFAGAVIGEALTGKKAEKAFRAGLGSLLGLMMGIGLKLAASIAMTFYFIKELVV